ncbi:hypothetical protein NEK97_00180 [Paenarthrobacter sp. UW852]|uniref:DUF6993 domain-containing protein n=1 Tax=Paenarthrobacter sp. UW852 TaxID=2951989 RepID=UPI0021484E2B|nr:hypothetical protein [Paenarthrobacter sp. UW852]MCR1159874.1 hypothetical protein [Paenarthrobacter sp. UW852]
MAALSVLAVTALALAACTGTSLPASSPSSAPSSLAPVATANVDPAVEDTRLAVEGTLKKLVTANAKPDREAVRAALVSAGIPTANVEVSVSRTPTGLDVDAMEAAALTGENCVMGQIRDGGVAVTVLPVLATGKCFVGDTR